MQVNCMACQDTSSLPSNLAQQIYLVCFIFFLGLSPSTAESVGAWPADRPVNLGKLAKAPPLPATGKGSVVASDATAAATTAEVVASQADAAESKEARGDTKDGPAACRRGD